MRGSLLVLMMLLAVGCAKTSPEPVATDASAPATDAMPADATLVSFAVPGMTCAHGCAPVVQETLEGLPHVVKVNVDFETKTAQVAVEKEQAFDNDAAIEALAQAGFDGSSVKN